jgi:hypothetical protein
MTVNFDIAVSDWLHRGVCWVRNETLGTRLRCKSPSVLRLGAVSARFPKLDEAAVCRGPPVPASAGTGDAVVSLREQVG